MQTKKALELIKKSDLPEKEKVRLLKLIDEKGMDLTAQNEILKSLEKHTKGLEKGVEKKEIVKKGLEKEILQDRLALDYIYYKTLKKLKEAYLEYEKGMNRLDTRLDDVFREAVKRVEEEKKRRIREQLKS